jgi:hypothetical protein
VTLFLWLKMKMRVRWGDQGIDGDFILIRVIIYILWKFSRCRPQTLRDCRGLAVSEESLHVELHQNGDEIVVE